MKRIVQNYCQQKAPKNSFFFCVRVFACLFLCSYALLAQTPSKPTTKHYYPYEEQYLASSPRKVLIKDTPLYRKGLEMLYVQSNFKHEMLTPPGKKKKVKVSYPDYQKALGYFLQSVEKENNLAGAFIATFLIEILGKNSPKYQGVYFDLIQKLSKNNNCKGLFLDGYYFLNGFGGVIKDERAGRSKLKKAYHLCAFTPYSDSIIRVLMQAKAEK
ncbi:hypothetical protein BKH46_07995 [Helicobacter sp. 12S02634-8]|uniref:hypothetical protein n=1 Tax=Helicobacter sp. 12S02634-8 TaxID=1476199 RepID=UPI000BA606E5|nr:hypothetical protein [Helicobacter sp. 12S02634-8]PAF46318.1 hypothetical protein BKH46_07995 [Helicobacter sp. 12S02634-8]